MLMCQINIVQILVGFHHKVMIPVLDSSVNLFASASASLCKIPHVKIMSHARIIKACNLIWMLPVFSVWISSVDSRTLLGIAAWKKMS